MILTALLMATATPAPIIRVERRGPFQAVVRDVQGDYSQHPSVTRELLTAIRPVCPDKGILFGVYPQDPDVVSPDNLRWQLGYTVPDRARCAVRSIAGYSLASRPAETDAVIDSTLGTSRADGLAMLAWLATSGYAQVGPTRIEYVGTGSDAATKVRIVVPVRRRTWKGPVLKGAIRE